MNEGKGTILYLGAELPDKDAASHRIVANAKILRDLGYDVVLLGDSKNQNVSCNILETEFEVFGFKCFLMRYPSNVKQRVHQLIGIKKIVEVCNTIPDLKAVILYNHPSISLLRMISYLKRRKIKVIADVTEWYSGKGHGVAFYIIKSLDTYLRMTIAHKKVDGLIVISNYLEDYYKKYNIPLVNIPPLNDIENKMRRKVFHKDLELMYAGSPGNKDKLNELVNAIGLCDRNVTLKIIGITSDEFEKKNRNNTYHYDKDKIRFYGRLSHDETLQMLRETDFSCFFREDNRVTRAGFPTKFTEAISCGTPVITNYTSNVAEYISEGRNGYIICELNSEEIVHILEKADNTIYVESRLFCYKRYIEQMKMFLSAVSID